ncbi:MAG TPA: T9SS type A sorting domain-containing protein [Flavobacteriales bacterium]|nr:T9SS type A sorting domain-containing protein [Flavobacteriales bacterium]
MKKTLLCTSFLLSSMAAFSQNQADIWYFGHNAGLDFTGGSPVVLSNGALYADEGCSSISTPGGTLLFYTDGLTVYNKNHVAMPNGTGLNGGASTTHPAIIVPQPGSSHIFYVFTLDEYGSSDGLSYSIVDMLLDGGNGDVTTKNTLVDSMMTEKLAVVKEAGGNDYWILVHKWGSNAFHAYQLTSVGFNATPVISNVGIVHSTSMIQNTYGQMKMTGCGDRIALADGYLDTLELFDFNTITGVVSNPIAVPVPDHLYGIEFSPNEQLLYVTTYENGGSIVQYDITSTNPLVIQTSAFTLHVTSGAQIYGMQLASDGKIYVVTSYSPYLGVINSPDVPSIGANYVDLGINLDTAFSGLITNGLSLPSFPANFVHVNKSCTVGMNDFIMDDVNAIYPNPSNTAFNFMPNLPHAQVYVYDQLGNLVEQFDNAKNSGFMFGSAYAPGVYMVVERNHEMVIQQKLVKQ